MYFHSTQSLEMLVNHKKTDTITRKNFPAENSMVCMYCIPFPKLALTWKANPNTKLIRFYYKKLLDLNSHYIACICIMNEK